MVLAEGADLVQQTLGTILGLPQTAVTVPFCSRSRFVYGHRVTDPGPAR